MIDLKRGKEKKASLLGDVFLVLCGAILFISAILHFTEV